MSTKIEWTDETWNVIVGCSKASPGCDNCYAESNAAMCANYGTKQYQAVTKIAMDQQTYTPCWTGSTFFVESALLKPFKWKKGKRIFVCSMGDLFHETVPFEWIDKVFAVMALCPQHTFQVLTKRPERMAEYLNLYRESEIRTIWSDMGKYDETSPIVKRYIQTLPNVWIGTTAENQEQANRRVPHLLRCQAALRFVSEEPMLGMVDLTNIDTGQTWPGKAETSKINALEGHSASRRIPSRIDRGTCRFIDSINTGKIDWVIAGGESGSNARPLHPDWLRLIRYQCELSGIPFMFKQWGEWVPFSKASGIEFSQQEKKPVGFDFKVLKAPGRDPYPVRMNCIKLGKKKSGRMLDGLEYSEFPEVTR